MASRQNKSAIEIGENTKSITDCDKLHDAASNAIEAPDEALKNVETFAKANHLKYKRNNTYCKICDCKISCSLERLEELEGQPHINKAAEAAKAIIPKTIPCSNKVPLTEYIISKRLMKDIMYFQEIIINDKICLPYASFETLTQNGVNLRCHTCEVSLGRGEAACHIEMWQHERGKEFSYVLTQFDTEFVREVRSGVYHCGFCNFFEGSMMGLQGHLKTVKHMETKTMARHRLVNHMQNIMEHRRKEAVRQLFIREMSSLLL